MVSDDKISSSTQSSSSQGEEGVVKKSSILIFDDNPMDYELLKLHLRQKPEWELTYVSSFEKFKAAFETGSFSAIICDYDLGMTNAIEVFEYTSPISPIPFIVVSGAQGEEKAIEILKTGITDYVLKDRYDKLPFVLSRALREYESMEHEREMLEKLRESENKFRGIFNSIIDVYFESDLNGIEKVLSPSIEDVLGYKPEDILMTNVLNMYVYPEQREAFLNDLAQFQKVHDYEISLFHKNGEERVISANAQLVYDSESNPIGIKGIYRDITDKKKQETEIIKREAQLRESQKMAKIGSWEINPITKEVALSEEFNQIFEWHDNNYRTDFYDFLQLVHPEDRLRLESNFSRFVKTGNELPYEFRIITPNGQLKYISTKMFKLNRHGEKNQMVSGIVQDITDLKKLEEEKNNVQRQALEMLEEMVEQRTRKIEEQRSEIERKNQDITDSIRYAKKVQMAILPNKEWLDAWLPQNFIFYLPKDIVAGDFYWAQQVEDTFILAVADCTGHGVPGAMVSVICYNALNRAVNEFHLLDPGAILQKTNELVVEFFSHGSAEIQDGMDISLITINHQKEEMRWAGANNPLLYTENGRLQKVEPHKTAIGNKEFKDKFNSTLIPYISGSSYYLLTDGYADQFGGPDNKKFMQKRLYALIELLGNKTIVKQEELVKRTFFDWKGQNEQVDDVALIGFRLK